MRILAGAGGGLQQLPLISNWQRDLTGERAALADVSDCIEIRYGKRSVLCHLALRPKLPLRLDRIEYDERNCVSANDPVCVGQRQPLTIDHRLAVGLLSATERRASDYLELV